MEADYDPRTKYLCSLMAPEFDKEFYFGQFDLDSERPSDPVVHYLFDGWRNQLDPSRSFSTSYYLTTYPDIGHASVNPFVHYLQIGKQEGRSGTPGVPQPAPKTLTLRGSIDGMTSDGFIEGWALDEDSPWRPLEVKIQCEGKWIASGLAHHYREDVLAAQIGTGWCGFRLRSNRSTQEIRRFALNLIGASDVLIAKSETTILLPHVRSPADAIDDIIATDPTIIRSVEYLRSCEPLFTDYIRRRGIDAFIRVAYIYILRRPVDDSGLRTYGNRLRRGTHKPFELLQILATSEEFINRRPDLVAPIQSSFPFRID